MTEKDHEMVSEAVMMMTAPEIEEVAVVPEEEAGIVSGVAEEAVEAFEEQTEAGTVLFE